MLLSVPSRSGEDPREWGERTVQFLWRDLSGREARSPARDAEGEGDVAGTRGGTARGPRIR